MENELKVILFPTKEYKKGMLCKVENEDTIYKVEDDDEYFYYLVNENTHLPRAIHIYRNITFYNIYVLSNNKVENNDWCYWDKHDMGIFRIFQNSLRYYGLYFPTSFACNKSNEHLIKKIIATTDSSLRLPLLTTNDIEKYIKFQSENINYEYFNTLNKIKNNMKELKIYPPEGYEIDRKKSCLNNTIGVIEFSPIIIKDIEVGSTVTIKDGSYMMGIDTTNKKLGHFINKRNCSEYPIGLCKDRFTVIAMDADVPIDKGCGHEEYKNDIIIQNNATNTIWFCSKLNIRII